MFCNASADHLAVQSIVQKVQSTVCERSLTMNTLLEQAMTLVSCHEIVHCQDKSIGLSGPGCRKSAGT